MRVIIAARLSRIAKGQTGIDTQDEDAREWAEDQGHEIIATVADRKSGRLAPWNRPNLRPWVTQDDHMALYDGIVAAKHDRLSRADWRDEADIRRWAEDHGKKLFLVDQNLQWPPRDADDRQRWDNAAEQSRREWESTSKRYRRMQKNLRAQKFFVGKRSFGYRIVECGDHKTLEIDEAEAQVVREIFRRYLVGESLMTIRDWLVTERVKPLQGQQWSSQAVRRMLHNPIYIGRVIANGETYMTVPPIIEPADFDKAQELLAGKATRGPASNDPAMLTGNLRCNHGHPMYRIKGRSVPSCPDGRYYYCNPEVAEKGNRLLVPLAYVEDVVNEALTETYGDWPHFVKKMSPKQVHANRIADIRQDIRELDPLAYSPDAFIVLMTEKRAELARLQAEASKAAGTRLVPDRRPDGSMRTIGEYWSSLDNAARRQWLKNHEWTVIISKMDATAQEIADMRADGLLPYTIQIDTTGYEAELEALGFPVRDFLTALGKLAE